MDFLYNTMYNNIFHIVYLSNNELCSSISIIFEDANNGFPYIETHNLLQVHGPIDSMTPRNANEILILNRVDVFSDDFSVFRFVCEILYNKDLNKDNLEHKIPWRFNDYEFELIQNTFLNSLIVMHQEKNFTDKPINMLSRSLFTKDPMNFFNTLSHQEERNIKDYEELFLIYERSLSKLFGNNIKTTEVTIEEALTLIDILLSKMITPKLNLDNYILTNTQPEDLIQIGYASDRIELNIAFEDMLLDDKLIVNYSDIPSFIDNKKYLNSIERIVFNYIDIIDSEYLENIRVNKSYSMDFIPCNNQFINRFNLNVSFSLSGVQNTISLNDLSLFFYKFFVEPMINIEKLRNDKIRDIEEKFQKETKSTIIDKLPLK